MKFDYKARDKEGNMHEGVVEASSRESAFLVVQSYDLYVVSLTEQKVPFYQQDFVFFEKVSGQDVVMISRQLAVMAESKIPIVEALQALSKQLEKRTLKEKILSIADKVEGGMPFSKALSSFPEIFSDFYVNIIKSGEVSGNMSESLSYLAEHIEREYQFRQKVTGAMFYPIFILVIFLGILLFLFMFIMPQLTGILLDAGGDIPTITLIVIAVSDFLERNGLYVLFGLIILVFASIKFFKTKQGKDILDEFILKLPGLQDFFRKTYIVRFSESLSTLITAGIPIVKALEITADIVNNKVYREAILELAEVVEQGRQLSEGMKKRPKMFSPILIQMTIVGERSGRLGSSLTNVVRFFRAEIERTIDRYISMLEPIMIILLGALVGGLVGSVLLPIYNISMSV